MAVRAFRTARRKAAPGLVAPQGAPSEVGGSAAGIDLAEAVARFLDALGLPAEVRQGSDLAETPRRVAEAWLTDLVDGYGKEPAEILAETIASPSRDLVVLTGIDFHSMCPHHLLPSRGLAHVAYLPGGRLAGFGQIVQLVDALAHRLVLQEDLVRQIPDALVQHLGARGAACVLETEQLCMTVRGPRRSRSRVRVEAFAGALARDVPARRRFLALATRAATRPARRSRR